MEEWKRYQIKNSNRTFIVETDDINDWCNKYIAKDSKYDILELKD